MKKHLWQVEHSYYCHETGLEDEEYESVDDFLSEYDESDFDMNLVVRWDWHPKSDLCDEENIEVIFVMQRKGYLRKVVIKSPNGAADELKFRRFLEPRFEHLKKLWSPL